MWLLIAILVLKSVYILVCYSALNFLINSCFHYTLVCVLSVVEEETTVSIRGDVSKPLGNIIGDLVSIDQGSSSCDPLCCTRFAPSGNLTDFLEPLLFGERMSGITDGDGPEIRTLLVSVYGVWIKLS